MKILGIGVDIIKNKRIESLIKNKKFILRTFGKNEVKFSKKILNKANYFAKRFAAKEALAKSIGTGFRNDLNMKDIEILNDKIGKPYYHKSKKINDIIIKKFKIKKYDLFLSISDENDYSVAFTILLIK
jgi:holo-[acyl-carrier protein] synthase|tara:strand:+ start:123 stop:509 length:387 start_codon:yes stop_codon:yes gene_type:complete